MKRWSGLVGLLVMLAGCATVDPPRPPRAATDADKLAVGRALVPLLVASELWRGPADGCAAALGVTPASTINLGVAPHATCKFALVVTEGALEKLTPPELQAALAHELGHVQLGHFAARQARRAAEKRTEDATGAAGGIGSAAVSVIPVVGPIIAAGMIGAQMIADTAAKSAYRGYDRQEELAADRFAVALLEKLQPGHCRALRDLLGRLERERSSPLWTPWASTHPTHATRIDDVTALCP